MSLDAYKLDKGFTEGVEITLDAAPDDVFVVLLPSMYNRKYSQALYSGMDFSELEDGTNKVNYVVAKYAKDDAFVEHCLLTLNGKPLPPRFVDEYPSAVDELARKADEMAAAIDERVKNTVKKSQPTSTGTSGGQAKMSSTAA